VHAVLGHVNHWGSGLVLGGSFAGLDQQQRDSRRGTLNTWSGGTLNTWRSGDDGRAVTARSLVRF
jgi:hypothetical protein